MNKYSIKDTFLILLIFSVLALISNALSSKFGFFEAVPGILILVAISMAGILMGKYLPGKIPAVAYVVTLGCILTFPGFPGSEFINACMKKVGFVSLCTLILAYAGVSIGKDLDAFAKSGWRIVVLSCVIFIGTYLGSAIIAQLILKSMGQI